MGVRRILQLGDPLLREVSTPVQPNEASAILTDLADTLHEFQRTHGFGRGISAVQIGAASRVVYIEIEGRCYPMLNPRFTYMSQETFRLWDDCFSFPDLLVWLERSETVEVAYQDETGAAQSLRASGAFSELLQHELDHLDGVLAVDRALTKESLITRREYDRQQAERCEVNTLQGIGQNCGGSVR